MTAFVPDDFTPPLGLDGPGFRLEPLGPQHNERDYEAWMSSIDHIRATPGFSPDGDWPHQMSLEDNMADLEMHARHFIERVGFTYSILDGDEVIGCLYMYPADDGVHDVSIRLWVTRGRADMDRVVFGAVESWVQEKWPFPLPDYPGRR